MFGYPLLNLCDKIILLGYYMRGQTMDNLLKQEANGDENYGPKGIGGWLILVSFAIVWSAIKLSIGAKQSISIFGTNEYKLLTTKGSEYYMPEYTTILNFEAIANIILLIGILIVLIFFFMQKRLFPKLYMGFILLNLTILLIDTALAFQLKIITVDMKSEMQLGIVRSIIYACIWIPYMIKSVRVKNTFVK